MSPARPGTLNAFGPSTGFRRGRASRGQSVVEFALILPVFLLLLLIAVDFGRLFFTYIQLSNTAREGAAYASANPTTDNTTLTTIALRESNVQAQRGEGAASATAACFDSAGSAIVCSSALAGDGAGNRVTVSVIETFTFFTPLIGNFWPGGLHIGTSATAAIAVYAASGGGTPAPTCSTTPSTPTFTWQSPDPTNRPFLISVNAGASPNQAFPCQNIGYTWDFGGVSNASPPDASDPSREGMTQDYEYLSGGTYTVRLVVSNAAGDSPVATQTISLGTTTCNAPVAAFTVSPALVIDKHGNSNWTAADKHNNPGTQFTFNGTASAFMADPACHPTWSWDVGDLTAPAPTIDTVVHSYAHAWAGQTVRVVLTTTNDAGTDTAAFDITLQ